MRERRPRIVLIAGMPRSGSTWSFNAARLLLLRGGAPVQAAWIEDYDPDLPAETHLVKAHEPGQVGFDPDLVFTNWRPIPDCLASLIRMGWLSEEPDRIRRAARHQEKTYQHWNARSDHEVRHDDILSRPASVVAAMARRLGVPLEEGASQAVARELAALKAPEAGHYDPMTLLHPGHRGGGRTITPDKIRRILAGSEG